MIIDNDSTKLWVTLGIDGDIRLGRGRTQKSITVDVHSPVCTGQLQSIALTIMKGRRSGRDGRI